MISRTKLVPLAALAAVTLGLLAPRPAAAFCGFYVSGANADLYNKATMVVMMREGTRTVLSMQNAYEGPPEDFAMVIPVPVVLSEDDVRTLPDAIFARVDELAAPRLVEYWEQDPCYVPPEYDYAEMPMASAPGSMMQMTEGSAEDLGVTVEAQFVVGEYEIAILGARDSSGLDTWLRREGYNIPEGAEPVLRPYVEAGTKFFVARVDIERVTRVNGRAVLSPLRFHYDTDTFSLPVRLGLLNSAGEQDLLVHILGRRQRYEVANYENVTIPTNLVVSEGVRNEFGPFYVSLFDRVMERNPGSVVTEYSWDASSCDPCPTPALTPEELMTLGADVVPGDPYGFTLTRLHYRYTREQLGEDLVFRAAGSIVGGRGMPDERGRMQEQVAEAGGMDNFQGRYVILNWWEGPIACSAPTRGRWGGPWPQAEGTASPRAATDTAFAERGRPLAAYLAEDVPSLGVTAAALGEGSHAGGPPPTTHGGGCASCAVGGRGGPAPFGIALALGLLAAWLYRRNRS